MTGLAVSIVTYKHSLYDLEPSIKSVLNAKDIERVIIIDNSPTRNLERQLKSFPVEYFHTQKNIGYGAGHNIAIAKSIESQSKYHLVLNPDVYFNPITIKKLLDYMEANPDIGNIMPKVLYPDNSIQYLCKLLPTPYDWIIRRFSPFKKMVEKNNSDFELKYTGYDKIMEVPYLSGCFMFLRLSALQKIGFFDENIFMYCEETDLCRRLIKNGYKTIYYPDAFIYHEFQKGSHKSFKLTWVGIQSAIYYFNKYGWIFNQDRKTINNTTIEKLKMLK